MSERAWPVARVRQYGAGQEHVAKYDGFGRYDLAAELVKGNQVQISQVEAGAGLGYRAAFPAAMCVSSEGLSTVLCRPFLDTSQAIGLGHFEAKGGRWRALRGLGLGQEVRLYQEDGTSNLATGVESRFTLPTNPMFALSLWRAEPGAGHNWSQPPYTEIHFGIGEQDEWAIAVPYGMPLFLMRRVGGTWYRVPFGERSVRLPTLEGNARGQRSFLWFGVMRGKAVISTDGFVEENCVCELPDGPVRIAPGKVSLWHNAGQWAFSWYPIQMAPAIIRSGAIDTGYATQESAGEAFCVGRTIPVRGADGEILTWVDTVDDTAEREGLTATQRSWRVQMWPYQHREQGVGTDPDTQETVDFATWVSPEWIAVQSGQFAEVEAQTVPTATEITGDLEELSGDQGAEEGAARYELTLDNQLGQHSELAEYRRLTVELGWRDKAGGETLAAVCDGYVVEPPRITAPGGGSTVKVNVLDPLLRLRDEKADGRTPVFDGWPVVDVFRWVLLRCGIPEEKQELEDTGVCLSVGEAEKPVWQVEPGRSWTEFLAEVARFDYSAGFYFDGAGVFHKACRHCHQKRTAEDVTGHSGELGSECPATVDWEMYTRGAIAPDPTKPGEVLDLRRTRQSLGSEEFANTVIVSGTEANGRPLRAVGYDTASLYDTASDRYVGWRKMDVWALPGHNDAATVNRLVSERLAQLAPRPEHVLVATPLLPQAQIGQVVRIHGGEAAGVEDQVYRITSVRHEVTRRPEQVAVTVLEARWIGSEQ